MIVGNVGNNHLTGGGGNDTFVFEIHSGNDTITDFSRANGNKDKIDVSSYHFQNLADLFAHASAVGPNHGDTLIQLSQSDTITLEHILLANLKAQDFIL